MLSKSLPFHLRMFACDARLNGSLRGGTRSPSVIGKIHLTGGDGQGVRVRGRILLASTHLNEGGEKGRAKQSEFTVRVSQVLCLLCKYFSDEIT